MDHSTSRIRTDETRVVVQQKKRWRGVSRVLRRLLDVSVAILGLLLLAPFFAVVAILIKRDTPGPVFYWGPRIGKGGNPFRILKFRTMYEQPECHDGPKITGSGDGRITPLGQWLRDTKLNELPQLWNVLVGEMSLVGPRPEDPELVGEWPAAARAELLSVRPGITSPASVLYRDEESLLGKDTLMADYLRDIMPSKLRLDLIYVRHRTILNDLDVIFWTVVTLLPQLKRKQVPQHSLFWGPLSRFLSRYFSWFVFDWLVALVAVGMAGAIWRSGQPLDLGLEMALLMAVLMAVVFSLVNALLRLDRVYWSKAPADAVVDLGVSCGLATAWLLAGNHFWPGAPLLPSGLLLISGLLAFLGFVTIRYRARILTGIATRWLQWRAAAPTMGERVLVIGAGEAGDFATWLLRKGDLKQAFSPVGMVDDAPSKQKASVSGLPVLGSTADIPALVEAYDVGLLLFSIVDIDPEDRERILALCRRTAAHLVMVPSILASLRFHFAQGTPAAATGGRADKTMSPKQLRQWLGEIEQLLCAGAMDAAHEKVRALRQKLTEE